MIFFIAIYLLRTIFAFIARYRDYFCYSLSSRLYIRLTDLIGSYTVLEVMINRYRSELD